MFFVDESRLLDSRQIQNLLNHVEPDVYFPDELEERETEEIMKIAKKIEDHNTRENK